MSGLLPPSHTNRPPLSSVAILSTTETPPSEAVYTPDSTASHTPEPSPRKSSHSNQADDMNEAKMEPSRGHTAVETEVAAPKVAEEEVAPSATGNPTIETPASKDAVADPSQKEKTKTKSKQKKSKTKCKKKKHSSKNKKLVATATDADADDDSDSDDSDADTDVSEAEDSDSDSDSSSDQDVKKKKKSKSKKKQKQKEKEKAAAKKKAKDKKKKKKEQLSDSSDSDSSSDSSEDSSKRKRRKRRARKIKVDPIPDDETLTEDQTDSNGQELPSESQNQLEPLLRALQAAIAGNTAATSGLGTTAVADTSIKDPKLTIRSRRGIRIGRAAREPKVGDKPQDGEVAYKRVDQIWDKHIHDYRIQETAKEQVDPFDGYVFHVRRRFDWENKYRNTLVDIKSKYLRDALQEVMKDVRAVSLVENEPSIDPNMLFLYLEEMRKFYKVTLKERAKSEKKKKAKKRAKLMREHLKLLVGCLDKDYEATKKNLEPMLKAGNITFDLIWALFKPNSIVYTTTYGATEQPRCFKVDQVYREKTFMRGEFYVIEGRYLEYDGKTFGLGDFDISIDHFKGPKKITSLTAYPLQYHKDPDTIRTQLIDRGKKFVSLAGMNFKLMKGLAFMKKKKQILKFNINGRVMVDPKTFRRENANYQVSSIHNNDDSDEESDDDECSCAEDEDNEREKSFSDDDAEESRKVRFKIIVDDNNKTHLVEVTGDDEEPIQQERLDKLSEQAEELGKKREFTEEELLIASSVVLGFSFVEKQWFEFSVSGIGDIVWDDGAFDSLVLPPNHKSIVKAQVCSHKFHGGETIDDVIQGKGKGLVFVLHGPPGVGKTLTAEGIAEFLRCPLYAVSAGDLGTDARIEHELNKIMTIAHSWGAVLLLDEADVFLEKRQHQDVHRNALVSVFLRLLEYFQGILFLTTNRVETFDEAFQSRIHIALKYNELGTKAKKEIWKIFITKVKEAGSEVSIFKETDYERLAKSNLNGRQIKNMVKTAQALAVFEKTPLNMEHVKRVLDVGESFERDLKGGTGYEDAMRSYT